MITHTTICIDLQVDDILVLICTSAFQLDMKHTLSLYNHIFTHVLEIRVEASLLTITCISWELEQITKQDSFEISLPINEMHLLRYNG